MSTQSFPTKSEEKTVSSSDRAREGEVKVQTVPDTQRTSPWFSASPRSLVRHKDSAGRKKTVTGKEKSLCCVNSRETGSLVKSRTLLSHICHPKRALKPIAGKAELWSQWISHWDHSSRPLAPISLPIFFLPDCPSRFSLIWTTWKAQSHFPVMGGLQSSRS